MYSKMGNFINGSWNNNSKEKIDVINPFNEEVLGQIPVSTETDLDAALESAHKSMQSWKETSPWDRSKIIKQIANLIRERADEIERVNRELTDHINLTEKRLLNEIKSLRNDIGDRVGTLEKYKWLILGGFISIGWILSKNLMPLLHMLNGS